MQGKISRLLAVSAIAITSGSLLHGLLGAATTPSTVSMNVERLDPALNSIVPANPSWRRPPPARASNGPKDRSGYRPVTCYLLRSPAIAFVSGPRALG